MKRLLWSKNWRFYVNKIERGRLAFLSFILFSTLATQFCFSQSLRDNIWMIGSFGQGVTFDFSTDTLVLYANNAQMTHLSTNASICDTLGNLLFYTNGVYIASGNHQPMWNGSGLDLGILNEFPQYGTNVSQAALILPLPGSPKIYYLFYKAVIRISDTELSSKFYYSIIDMSKNNGKGMVVEKNQLVMDGVYLDWEK